MDNMTASYYMGSQNSIISSDIIFKRSEKTKPRTKYNFFFMRRFNVLRERNPAMEANDITRLIANEWKDFKMSKNDTENAYLDYLVKEDKRR